MRFILITSKLNFETAGGAVLDLHWKAKRLVELGHDVTVITAFSRANLAVPELAYKLREENIAPFGDLLSIQRGVYRILKKYENDADAFYVDGHIFLYGAGFYRLLGGKTPVAAFFNIRLNSWRPATQSALTVSARRSLWQVFRWWIERIIGVQAANRIDAFIFNTPHLAALYYRFGIGSGKGVIIEDFIDTRAISEKYPRSSEQFENNNKKIMIFCSGRMLPEKGFDLVIRAFSKVADKDKYELIVSGSGPEEDNLRLLAQALGLESRIKFPGWVSRGDLLDFFARADIFVFPRWWLEYGSAILTEAMAFGLSSIIPGGGALEWLVSGGALTFKDGDIDDMARQIERLGKDAQLRRAISEKAIIRARELSYQNLGDRLAGILESITK
ncbi:MAG: glycosyltransferase family 4 protein [Candidatus Niyogibacteria bacterium]|nr:MAG: glycosyltransferase family 4 protein [Candidatus Niyogibacteria bacterium]